MTGTAADQTESLTAETISSPAPAKPDAWRREWLELGDFIVSFGISMAGGERRLQTRVYHSQGDVQEHWDGVDMGHLSAWITERARSFIPTDLPKRTDPVLELTNLEVTVPRENVMCLAGHLLLDAYPVNVQPSRVDVYLTSLEFGGERRVARDTGDVACYRIFAVEFPVPPPGRYRLSVQARLLGREDVKIEREGPIIRVE